MYDKKCATGNALIFALMVIWAGPCLTCAQDNKTTAFAKVTERATSYRR